MTQKQEQELSDVPNALLPMLSLDMMHCFTALYIRLPQYFYNTKMMLQFTVMLQYMVRGADDFCTRKRLSRNLLLLSAPPRPVIPCRASNRQQTRAQPATGDFLILNYFCRSAIVARVGAGVDVGTCMVGPFSGIYPKGEKTEQ